MSKITEIHNHDISCEKCGKTTDHLDETAYDVEGHGEYCEDCVPRCEFCEEPTHPDDLEDKVCTGCRDAEEEVAEDAA